MVYKIGAVRVITYATEDIHSAVAHRNTLRERSFLLRVTRSTWRIRTEARKPTAITARTSRLWVICKLSRPSNSTKPYRHSRNSRTNRASVVIPGPLAKMAFFRYYNARATHRAKLLANSANNGELIRLPNRCWNVSGASFFSSARERNALFMK